MYMIVAIISDSHDNVPAIERFIKEIEKYNVSALIHAGDIIAPFSLKLFGRINLEKYFVFGNNDGERKVLKEVAENQGIKLEDVLELELNKKKIIVYHGTINCFLESLVKSNLYDVVIYGHTHKREVRKEGKTLIINPGELCGYLTGKKTFALLDLNKMSVDIYEI